MRRGDDFDPDYLPPTRARTQPAAVQPADPEAAPPPAAAPAAPAGAFDRTRFRDEWMRQAPGTNLSEFVNSHPDFASGVRVYGSKGDKADLPTGERGMDLTIGAGTGMGRPGWGAGFGPGEAGGYGGGMSAGMGGVGGAGGNSFSYADPAIHDAIMRLLKRGETPLTADDPTLKAQFDPVSRTIDRSATQSRAAAAERLAAQGVNQGGQGGAIDSTVNAINERAGEQKSSAMGGMVTNELAGRRADVANSLQFAQGEERMQLQKMLADIDAQLKSRGLDLEGRSLDQQDQHFYDNMGYNIGKDNAMYDYLYNQATR